MVCWVRRNQKAEEGIDKTATEHVDALKPSEADVKADAVPVEGRPLDAEVVDIAVDGETPKPVEEPKNEAPQAVEAEVPTADAPKGDDVKSTGSKKSFLSKMSGRFSKRTSKESSKPKKEEPTAEVKEETPEQDSASQKGEAPIADVEAAEEEKPKDENDEKQEEKHAEEEKKVEE